MHRYTEEQLRFLADNAQGRYRRELTDLFNARFGLQLSVHAITGTCKRYGYLTGLETKFRPGHKTWNAGVKGSTKANSGSFRPGMMPHNWKPVGTRIVGTDGYAKVKIAEPREWAFVHVLLWRERHGELPPGQVVIFADGDKTNFATDNLVAVSRAELAVLNKQRMIYPDADLTRAGIAVAKLLIKARERQKRVEK